MPMTPQQLRGLLDHLDANLKSCDHTRRLTAIWLDAEQLDKDRVLPWLAEHGGYCDCEVLSNLDDLANSLVARPIARKPRPKKKRPRRSLATIAGWDLSRLPKPWRIANAFAADEPLAIEMGKKGGCRITIVEASLPPGDQSADDYWSELWYSRTELPERSAIRVTHGSLELPDRLRSTVAATSAWTPVYCWIAPESQEWYVEVQTEMSRQRGDLPQVARLITQLQMGREP